MYTSSTFIVLCTVQSCKYYSKLLSLILDIIHTVTRSQFIQVCARYSGYVTQNSYVCSRVLKKKTSILVAIFFVTRDLNVRIQVGKQLFWIQHIQII